MHSRGIGAACVGLAGLAIGACTGAPQDERTATRGADPASQVQEVFAYRACESAPPGALVALPRAVPADLDPIAAAVGELLRGVSDEERARGCRSFFSARTENALHGVRHSAAGDTVHLDFRDLSAAIPDVPGATSFLPPGVMAELTWTIFDQFPDVEAIRFAFDGDERRFWSWVADDATEPQAFTRTMWERV